MKRLNLILILFVSIAVLTSCDHKVVMNTVVHEDGSLDKTIVIEADSVGIDKNFIGIRSTKGWKVTVLEKDTARNDDQGKFVLTFNKHFNSSEDANRDLAAPNDTLFRVTSHFDKKFRWFYTYIRYSDTYHAINRLQVPIEDYFTLEDYAFIDRLPAEGKSISAADSLFLDRLNDKIFDVYGTRALFEAYYQRLENLLKSEKQQAWIDTLNHHKRKLFEAIQDDKQINDFSDLLRKAGISNLPVSNQAMVNLEKEMETLTNFISKASNGKYMHSITMPYNVVHANADSIAGNTLYWQPSSIKFLLNDYEMVGEARTLNIWPLVVSITFILITITLIFRKRRF